jgi:hypothetical protein
VVRSDQVIATESPDPVVRHAAIEDARFVRTVANWSLLVGAIGVVVGGVAAAVGGVGVVGGLAAEAE